MQLLVFRLSSLGDVAMCVPVVVEALNQNQDLKIDFVTPKFLHSFFPPHDRLRLIDFDKKRKHKGLKGVLSFYKSLDIKYYDAFVDLHNVLRSNMLKTLFILCGSKVVTLNKGRKEKRELINHRSFKPLQHTTERYAAVFKKLGLLLELDHILTDFHQFNLVKRNSIGIAPFAAHQGKMYNIQAMRRVVEELQKTYQVSVFGSKKELDSILDWEQLSNVVLVRKDSIQEELQAISSQRLMVSMDSANMHMASLVGVPVVSMWGVTHPYAGFLGYGQSKENIIQDESLAWRPTSIYGNKLGPDENPNGMKNIKPEHIVSKISKAIG